MDEYKATNELDLKNFLKPRCPVSVGDLMGVSFITVRNMEVGQILNPMKLQMYGIVLERYYASIKGYVPAYRKIGTDTFKFAEELEDAV